MAKTTHFLLPRGAQAKRHHVDFLRLGKQTYVDFCKCHVFARIKRQVKIESRVSETLPLQIPDLLHSHSWPYSAPSEAQVVFYYHSKKAIYRLASDSSPGLDYYFQEIKWRNTILERDKNMPRYVPAFCIAHAGHKKSFSHQIHFFKLTLLSV